MAESVPALMNILRLREHFGGGSTLRTSIRFEYIRGRICVIRASAVGILDGRRSNWWSSGLFKLG